MPFKAASPMKQAPGAQAGTFYGTIGGKIPYIPVRPSAHAGLLSCLNQKAQHHARNASLHLRTMITRASELIPLQMHHLDCPLSCLVRAFAYTALYRQHCLQILQHAVLAAAMLFHLKHVHSVTRRCKSTPADAIRAASSCFLVQRFLS